MIRSFRGGAGVGGSWVRGGGGEVLQDKDDTYMSDSIRPSRLTAALGLKKNNQNAQSMARIAMFCLHVLELLSFLLCCRCNEFFSFMECFFFCMAVLQTPRF